MLVVAGCTVFYTRIVLFKKNLEVELNRVFEQIFEVRTEFYLTLIKYRWKKIIELFSIKLKKE